MPLAIAQLGQPVLRQVAKEHRLGSLTRRLTPGLTNARAAKAGGAEVAGIRCPTPS